MVGAAWGGLAGVGRRGTPLLLAEVPPIVLSVLRHVHGEADAADDELERLAGGIEAQEAAVEVDVTAIPDGQAAIDERVGLTIEAGAAGAGGDELIGAEIPIGVAVAARTLRPLRALVALVALHPLRPGGA